VVVVLPAPPQTLWAIAADGSIAIPTNAAIARSWRYREPTRAKTRHYNSFYNSLCHRGRNIAAPFDVCSVWSLPRIHESAHRAALIASVSQDGDIAADWCRIDTTSIACGRRIRVMFLIISTELDWASPNTDWTLLLNIEQVPLPMGRQVARGVDQSRPAVGVTLPHHR
jgi:hypothetical protein